jgi:quercetin dioxygenase-like cupin family protein
MDMKKIIGFLLSINLVGVCAVAIEAEPKESLYFDAKSVNQAIDKARPLIETAKYRIVMSKHDTAGEAEIHLKDTDIIYCLDGEAEFVTGGKAIDAKETSANELRGKSIVGGQTREIKKGDILVIPPNTPHWFKSVQKSFRYSAVKIPE